jgi:transposase
MKKPAATRQKEKTEIEQLSQAELVEMVLALQKIIEELQDKLAIATGNSRTTSQTSSKPPSTDLLQKPEKATVKPEADQKRNQADNRVIRGKPAKGLDE